MARTGLITTCILFILGVIYFFSSHPSLTGQEATRASQAELDAVMARERREGLERDRIPLQPRTILYYQEPGKNESYQVFFASRTRRNIARGEQLRASDIEAVGLNNNWVPFGVMSGFSGVVGSVAAMDIPANAILKADNLQQWAPGACIQNHDHSVIPLNLYQQEHGWHYGP